MGSNLAIILVLGFEFAWGQATVTVNPSHPTSETAETASFATIDKKWMVQGVLEAPFYSFYLGAPAVNGVAYLPNFAPRLGPRIVYRDFGALVTFGLPLPGYEKRRRGDSTYRNFILNSYWRQDAFDIYFQKFRGFYVASPLTELSDKKPDRYPQLPDAQVLNFGLNWYHVFNPSRYSLKAAFDLSEFQIKSGGSWMMNPFYTHAEIFLGNKFIAGSDPNALTSIPNLAAGRFDTLGCTFGYGYNYVDGHFFTAAQLAWGPGLQVQRFQRSDGNDSDVLTAAAKLNINLAIGWNESIYNAGVKVLVDSLWAKVQDTQVSSSLVSGQLFFGGRF